MMYLKLYLLMKATTIGGVIFGIGLVIFLGSIFFIIGIIACASDENDEEKKKRFLGNIKRWKLPALATGAFFLIIIGKLFPTTKEIAVIYVTPKIINSVSQNEELKKIPVGIVKLANEWISELSPKDRK